MNAGLKNGLIYGLVSIVIGLVIYLINARMLFSSWYMILGFILMFGFMAKACIDARNNNGGFISFGDAFMAAWITVMVGAVLGMIWQYVLNTFIDPSLVELQQEATAEWIGGLFEGIGMDKETLLEQMEAQGNQGSNPAYMLLGLLCMAPIMAIPAAIFGLIFKRGNKNLHA